MPVLSLKKLSWLFLSYLFAEIGEGCALLLGEFSHLCQASKSAHWFAFVL